MSSLFVRPQKPNGDNYTEYLNIIRKYDGQHDGCDWDPQTDNSDYDQRWWSYFESSQQLQQAKQDLEATKNFKTATKPHEK